MSKLLRPAVIVAAIAISTLAPRLTFAQADIIRGRVIGPDSLPLEGARVTATSIGGNVSRQAQTNKDGRYTITFPNGEGDYMMTFAALGFSPRRYELKRMADEEILIADAKLQRSATVLGAVEVQAPRQRVDRNQTNAPDIGGTEQTVAPAALPAADLGDLAAMAATLPGVTMVPGADGDPSGFSVLGLGADQNQTTLNGMNFGGSSLPRDAGISTSVVTSPYDVSRGGFSGAQLNARARPGSNFSMRGMSLNLDAPQMQWTDRAASSLGQEYTAASLGGMASGPLVMDKAFYNVAWQLGRRANDIQTLTNTGALGLQTAGVSADSVRRLLSILTTRGVPISARGVPNNRLADNGSVFGSIDLTPPNSSSGQSFNLAFNGGWNRANPMFSQTTALAATGSERSGYNGALIGRHTSYIKNVVLSELSLGANAQHNGSDPYLMLPAGRVRVNSTFSDGTNGLSTLAFGGASSMNNATTNTSFNAVEQLSWFSSNNKHRLKATGELRRDGYSSDQTGNVLGSFTYNSLADLEANRPASFSRLLSPRHTNAGQLIAGASLGDAWRKSSTLQFQYGVRLDANRWLDTPAFNQNVMNAFGVRNDVTPNDVYISPRFGFSWTYGAAPQVAAFEGAARVPRAVVRGGIGVFQNTPQVTAIGSMLDNTGLPSAVQQITCVGSSTPIPDWNAYAADVSAIPSACANGTSVFSNSAPNVSLYSADWKAPRSLRSNLQWNGPVAKNRLSATIEGTYSLNQNQGSLVDLNFAGVPRFTLSDEGRPVFVQSTSIVPATGSVAPADARKSALFSRVSQTVSDLRSESRQLRVSINPTRFSTSWSWGGSYVYSNVRERVRGFSGTTAGNPLDIEWARSSSDARHQFTYNLGYNFFDAIRVSWFGRFSSGTPFTPMVSGDVNGDGYFNDRAYVFNPSGAGVDPAIAAGIQSLLASGSDAARSCLASQLGKLAERNSCQGPWTSTASLNISFNPAKVRMPQRATLSFSLQNPLGAADLAMHGSSNLRGWGQPALPDANLLYVRGFDAASQKFKYDVNQRFGSTNPARSTARQPTILTAMIRMDIGPTRERQMLSQQLDRGRRTPGQKLPEQTMRAMFQGGGLPNPLATILRQQDTLKLTPQQADSIATLNRWFTVKNDSIWSPVAKFLGALPNDYDHGEAYDRYITARRASIDLLSQIGPIVKDLLTPEQQRKLPAFIASYLEPRYLASIRNGTMSYTGNPSFGGGGGGGGGTFVGAGGGGGGGNVVIIRQ